MVAEHITNLPVTGKDSGKRSRTQMLVLHSAETPLASGYAVSVTNNWLNRPDVEASINAFAGPDTLVRAVNTDYAAWHATWANRLSVGYETTGYAAFTRAQWLTAAGKNMIDRLGREMAADARIYGIPLRYLSNSEVNQIANGNTTIRGIATHRQIDPVNRTDPGDGFPYDVLLNTIKAYSGVPTPPKKEDEMSFTIEDLLNTKINRRGGTQKGSTTIRTILEFMDANILENGPDAVLDERIQRGGGVEGQTTVRSTVAWLDANLAALRSMVEQLATKQGVTIDYARINADITKALAEGINISGSITTK